MQSQNKIHLTDEEMQILKELSNNNEMQLQMRLRSSPVKIRQMIEHYSNQKVVLDALKENGVIISALYYMQDPKFDEKMYRKAIPILVTWLEQDLPVSVKAEIITVLIQRKISQKQAFPVILSEFKKVEGSHEKNEYGFYNDYVIALGNAFLRWVDDSNASEIFGCFQNKKLENNGFLLSSLTNFKKSENKEKAKKILINKLKSADTDITLIPGLISALRKLKVIEAREFIEPYLKHDSFDVKTEAEKTIAAFDKFV